MSYVDFDVGGVLLGRQQKRNYNMSINRILTANWVAQYGTGLTTIQIDQLENVDQSLTNRDDWYVPIYTVGIRLAPHHAI